jgi:hypothetical protein
VVEVVEDGKLPGAHMLAPLLGTSLCSDQRVSLQLPPLLKPLLGLAQRLPKAVTRDEHS